MTEKSPNEEGLKHPHVTLAAALAAAGIVIGARAAIRHKKRGTIKLLENPQELDTHGRRKIDMHTAVNHIAAAIIEKEQATASEVRELAGLSRDSAHYLLKLLEKDRLIVYTKLRDTDDGKTSYYAPTDRLLGAADDPESPPVMLSERREIVRQQLAMSTERDS